MTCIAALVENGKVYMAADSQCTTGDVVGMLSEGKIIKKDDILMGVCGKASIINGIRYDLYLPARHIDDTDNHYIFKVGKAIDSLFEIENKYRQDAKDANAGIIIGYKGKIYEYSGGGGCILAYSNDFLCDGSGWKHAQGSLFTTQKMNLSPKERLRLALESAIHFCASCGGDITYEEV